MNQIALLNTSQPDDSIFSRDTFDNGLEEPITIFNNQSDINMYSSDLLDNFLKHMTNKMLRITSHDNISFTS